MTSILDSRLIRMTRWLIDQDGPRSTAEMANDLGLSERVVRYRLASAERFLEEQGASLTRQRGLGLVVVADDETRERIRSDLDNRLEAPRVYTPEEREHLLVAALLWSAPSVVSLDQLNLELEVSKTSARRDLHRCEPWLERNGLPLLRKPGEGVLVTGTERQIRRATVQLFLEAVPGDALEELTNVDFSEAQLIRTRVPEGLRLRLASLPLHKCSKAVRSAEPLVGSLDRTAEVVFALYLAVVAARSNAGRDITFDAGQHVSLMDHPASETVRGLMRMLAIQGVELPTEELAGITEYLLGLDALALVKREPVDISAALDHFLAEAGQRLHPSLADDAELRTNLALHLGRLGVRLRHGLPIHNPLLAEVIARYPDVYRVATDLALKMGDHFGSTLNDDEVGFLTMYLSGAMERTHLRPRKRALVVCPSGMATVWVLVSRIQAEFPELALVQVLSARGYEDLDETEFDLVIATIPLPTQRAPVVVVSPLLSAADIRRVNSVLLQPTENEP